MALGDHHPCRIANLGSSSIFHSVHRQNADLAHNTTGLTLRANCCALSTHRTCPLLQGQFTRCLVEQHPPPSGNPRDTGRLAYKECSANHFERHSLLTYFAGLRTISLVCEKTHYVPLFLHSLAYHAESVSSIGIRSERSNRN